MTYIEAMESARKDAAHAKQTAQKEGVVFLDAYVTGWLIACLASDRYDLARAKAELERHESFIKAQ